MILADDAPALEFVFTNDLARHNSYGIIGTGRGVGHDSMAAYLPAARISATCCLRGCRRLSRGNSFPPVPAFEAQFASYAGADFRLAGSAWQQAGTDGLDLGVAFDCQLGGADFRGFWSSTSNKCESAWSVSDHSIRRENRHKLPRFRF